MPLRRSPAALLAAAWLAAVAAIALAQALWGSPHATALASTGDEVAHGKLWPLVTSGLVIAGAPVAQLLGTALVVAGVIRAFGAGVFWLVALAGHLGATLLTYGLLALAELAGVPGVDELLRTPDFGISAVWAACLGALAVAAGTRRGREVALALGVAGVAVFGALVPLTDDLGAIEHIVAFGCGAGVAAAVAVRRRARANVVLSSRTG